MMSHRLLIALPLGWLLAVTQAVFAQEQELTRVVTPDGEVLVIPVDAREVYDENGQRVSITTEDAEFDAHMPSPREMSLHLSMMSIILDTYSEGKFAIHLFEDIDAFGGILTSLVGLSEAQRLHIKAVMEGIEKRFEQGFEDGTANIEELLPEEFRRV